MADEVKRQVALAISQQRQPQVAPPEHNGTADLSQRKSSCASTSLPADTGIATIETTAQQRYPVDEITQRTPCELQTASKNLTFMVAYGTAMPTKPGDVYHGQEIPARHAKVGVEEVCNDWMNLDLNIPVGDGETTLADATHGYILWDRRYIILKPTDQGSRLASLQPAPGSPPPPPSSRAAPEHSPSPLSPG
jgi:hypothetical protein